VVAGRSEVVGVSEPWACGMGSVAGLRRSAAGSWCHRGLHDGVLEAELAGRHDKVLPSRGVEAKGLS